MVQKFSKYKLIVLLVLLFVIIFLFTEKSLFTGYVINTQTSATIDPGIRVMVPQDFNGETTDFVLLNDTELENLNNLTLDKPLYGKITFGETINLSENSLGDTVDLSSYVNISNNYIEIDTSVLSSFNKSATLILYTLDYDNPRIIKNGAVCPSEECTKLDYSSGTLTFIVNSFSYYYAEETPIIPGSTSPSSGGNSGGGGGGKVILNPKFEVNKELVKVEIKQGETVTEKLKIKNTGNINLNIKIEIKNLENILVLSEDNFNVPLNQEKEINLNFYSKNNQIPEVYLGKIIIDSNGIIKILNIIVEVKEKNPLFDIKTNVLTPMITYEDTLNAQISINNLGDILPIDGLLYYAVKDFNGRVYTFKEESLAIDQTLDLVREIKLPLLPPGDYILYSKISYNKIQAISSDSFKIIKLEKPSLDAKNITLSLIILVVLIILLPIILLLKKKFTKPQPPEIKDFEYHSIFGKD